MTYVQQQHAKIEHALERYTTLTDQARDHWPLRKEEAYEAQASADEWLAYADRLVAKLHSRNVMQRQGV